METNGQDAIEHHVLAGGGVQTPLKQIHHQADAAKRRGQRDLAELVQIIGVIVPMVMMGMVVGLARGVVVAMIVVMIMAVIVRVAVIVPVRMIVTMSHFSPPP